MVYLFSTFSDFRSLAAKDMKLKMSCGRKKIPCGKFPMVEMSGGGKSCSKEFLRVVNSLRPNMSLFEKYLTVGWGK